MTTTVQASLIGESHRRQDGDGLLTGRAVFTADLILPCTADMAIARTATPQYEDFYRGCCTPASAFIQPPDAGQIDLSIIVPAGRRHGVRIISPPPSY